MPNTGTWFRGTFRILFVAACLILVLQATAARMLKFGEAQLRTPALHELPFVMGNWTAAGEQTLEEIVTAVLKPDAYILRDYATSNGASPINLFVAYFKSIQNTYGPHSPRICLPGAGWLISSAKITNIDVPGRTGGIPVNEYIMQKSDQNILVVYWYQNNRNIWAEEFRAKLSLLPDLIRYRRSDVSLVRLITPLRGSGSQAEWDHCVEFTRLLLPQLVNQFETTQ